MKHLKNQIDLARSQLGNFKKNRGVNESEPKTDRELKVTTNELGAVLQKTAGILPRLVQPVGRVNLPKDRRVSLDELMAVDPVNTPKIIQFIQQSRQKDNIPDDQSSSLGSTQSVNFTPTPTGVAQPYGDNSRGNDRSVTKPRAPVGTGDILEEVHKARSYIRNFKAREAAARQYDVVQTSGTVPAALNISYLRVNLQTPGDPDQDEAVHAEGIHAGHGNENIMFRGAVAGRSFSINWATKDIPEAKIKRGPITRITKRASRILQKTASPNRRKLNIRPGTERFSKRKAPQAFVANASGRKRKGARINTTESPGVTVNLRPNKRQKFIGQTAEKPLYSRYSIAPGTQEDKKREGLDADINDRKYKAAVRPQLTANEVKKSISGGEQPVEQAVEQPQRVTKLPDHIRIKDKNSEQESQREGNGKIHEEAGEYTGYTTTGHTTNTSRINQRRVQDKANAKAKAKARLNKKLNNKRRYNTQAETSNKGISGLGNEYIGNLAPVGNRPLHDVKNQKSSKFTTGKRVGDKPSLKKMNVIPNRGSTRGSTRGIRRGISTKGRGRGVRRGVSIRGRGVRRGASTRGRGVRRGVSTRGRWTEVGGHSRKRARTQPQSHHIPNPNFTDRKKFIPVNYAVRKQSITTPQPSIKHRPTDTMESRRSGYERILESNITAKPVLVPKSIPVQNLKPKPKPKGKTSIPTFNPFYRQNQ